MTRVQPPGQAWFRVALENLHERGVPRRHRRADHVWQHRV